MSEVPKMRKFTDIFIERPVLATVVSLTVLVLPALLSAWLGSLVGKRARPGRGGDTEAARAR